PGENLTLIVAKEIISSFFQRFDVLTPANYLPVPRRRHFDSVAPELAMGPAGSRVFIATDLCAVTRPGALAPVRIAAIRHYLGMINLVERIRKGLTRLRTLPKNAEQAFAASARAASSSAPERTRRCPFR